MKSASASPSVSQPADVTRCTPAEYVARLDLRVEALFERLSARFDSGEIALLRQAYALARRAHEGQFRKGGEPYIMHPVAVATIIAEDFIMDANSVAAGFLHDVVEDTQTTLEEIEEVFGKNVMTLIDGVTGSGVPTAVVAPRLYLENLLLPVVLGPVREEGVLRYPLPASFPVSWSSHLDVAEVVTRLLTDASPTTGTVGVGHLPGLTGPDLAAAFSSCLGREVRFEGITPEAFGELITPLFGPAAAPVVELYRALNAQDGNTIAEDNSAQELLGLRPRSIERWLEDLAVS